MKLSIRTLSVAALGLFSTGCYYLRSGYEHFSILAKAESVEQLIEEHEFLLAENSDSNLSTKRPNRITLDKLRKLKLTRKTLQFIKEELKLSPGKHYQRIALLDRDAISWIVMAAEPWELKPYLWSYPIVGRMPYRGYFSKEEAVALEHKMKAQGYDTYLRGVVAYSTLGWFNEPLTTPLLGLKDHHLVETLIHEIIHSHLFIKDQVDFNESLATFLGIWGAQLFYQKQGEPEVSQMIQDELQDQQLFSEFIGKELQELKAWYQQEFQKLPKSEEELAHAKLKKSQKIQDLQTRFDELILPKLKTEARRGFGRIQNLNNARLLGYKTYFEGFAELSELRSRCGGNFLRTFQALKKLENEKAPKEALKNWISEQRPCA